MNTQAKIEELKSIVRNLAAGGHTVDELAAVNLRMSCEEEAFAMGDGMTAESLHGAYLDSGTIPEATRRSLNPARSPRGSRVGSHSSFTQPGEIHMSYYRILVSRNGERFFRTSKLGSSVLMVAALKGIRQGFPIGLPSPQPEFTHDVLAVIDGAASGSILTAGHLAAIEDTLTGTPAWVAAENATSSTEIAVALGPLVAQEAPKIIDAP